MSLCPLVPGERFELPTNGLQNRCSTTELTRQINDLQDRSEAWLQLVAVSSRNSRPALTGATSVSAASREVSTSFRSSPRGAPRDARVAGTPLRGPSLALDSRLRGNERSLLYGRSVLL